MSEPCAWPVTYTGCNGCEDIFTQVDEGDQVVFEQAAVEYLWNSTNQVFGLCDVTARPCRDDCSGGAFARSTFWGRGPGYDPAFPSGTSRFLPVLIGGEWHNMGCGCVGVCSCGLTAAGVLRLPGPVDSITSIKIDGVVLDPSAYAVLHGRLLVRSDGEVWPTCQNILLPSTEPDTFEVVYKRGIPVPIGGQLAAGILATEFAKAACGDETCALPEGLQSLSRQGIQMDMFATDDSYLRTGIWFVDNWIDKVTRPKSFASVRSVDVPNRS